MFKIFSNLFKKEEPVYHDFSKLAVDLHSHLIPDIDDGVDSLDESLEVIRSLNKLGFKKIITTPHIMSGGYDNSPENILPGLEKVRAHLKENQFDIEIDAAAEYYVDDNFTRILESDQGLLLIKDQFLLFELSYLNPPSSLHALVFDLQARGITPLLAHPERYPYFYKKNLDDYRRLKDQGVLFQVNISSLVGVYSEMTRKVGQDLIDNDMVEFLATDCHNMRHIGYLQKAKTDKFIHRILEEKHFHNSGLL